jgi:hypothetical protein
MRSLAPVADVAAAPDGKRRRALGPVLPLLAVFFTAALLAWPALAADPIALRIESFVVAPAHSPSAVVVVMNHGKEAFQGTVRVKPPEGWQLSPAEQEVAVAPGEAKRVPFIVKRGTIVESNRYPLEAIVTGGGLTVTRSQEVVTASAPYFKPTIDGDVEEWKDAIPVTWSVGGKKTVVSTYWNRRQFSVLVAVEEDKLVPFRDESGAGAPDAVQVAISPQDARTGTSPDEEADRYEFLLVSTGRGTAGKCFLLAEPGMKLAVGQKPRELGPLEYKDAELAVSRRGAVTYYECSIPFRLMRERIPPSEGREFHLSVLVHDPDGTGIRDWGQEAGLAPCQRSRLAWSLWPGAKWGDEPPFDNKTEWGLCSSKY